VLDFRNRSEQFADYFGMDYVADEQAKDARHGRVVRDYLMLQENKERMRSLISLLSVDDNNDCRKSIDRLR
jgi:hypothetical protein